MEQEYYKSKESVEEYVRLAKDVSGHELIQKLKKILKEKATILEIGSGPGTDWEILNQYYKVTGSDNSKAFLDHLKKRHPDDDFLNLDAVTLEIDSSYDGIYSNKVMHHLQSEELRESIKRQCAILNENGIICHSFWKGEGTENFKGMFVNYHNSSDLETFFGALFDIVLIEEYKEFDEGDSLLLIARKKN